jgi:hypothetical protein
MYTIFYGRFNYDPNDNFWLDTSGNGMPWQQWWRMPIRSRSFSDFARSSETPEASSDKPAITFAPGVVTGVVISRPCGLQTLSFLHRLPPARRHETGSMSGRVS